MQQRILTNKAAVILSCFHGTNIADLYLIHVQIYNLGLCYLCKLETHLENSKDSYQPKLSTVDHIIPISKGGPHTWENVRNCCLKCNITKHDRIY